MPPMIREIPAPPAAGPIAGSGALLPTLGRAVTEVTDERDVGFSYVPEGCGVSVPGHHNICDEADAKTVEPNQALVEAWPFNLVAADQCSPWQLDRDWQGRAQRQLLASQSFQVAAELWSGAAAQAQITSPPIENEPPNKWLASEDADTLTDPGDATSVTDALARLEYGLGQCLHGGRGIIHATLHAATYWYGEGLLRREGNQLLTIVDTIVVADAGYDGSGPNGETMTDGSQWAYATGAVTARLGPVRMVPSSAATLREGLNRGDNTVTVYAERAAAVAFEPCCHLAVQMDLGMALIGGAS